MTEFIQMILINETLSTIRVSNFFSFVEFSVITLIYAVNLDLKSKGSLFFWAGFLVTCLIFIFSDMHTPMTVFNGFYILLIIIFSLYYFYLENEKEETKEHMQDFFWFNSAFLLFFGTSFFIFLFDDFILTADRAVGRLLWTIHLINNMIFYALLTVGIWKTSGRLR
jgi:hypothetical protein